MIYLKTYETFHTNPNDEFKEFDNIRPNYGSFNPPPNSENWKVNDVIYWNMNNNFYNTWIKTFDKCIITKIDDNGNIYVINTRTYINVYQSLPKYYFMSKEEYKNMMEIKNNTDKYNL